MAFLLPFLLDVLLVTSNRGLSGRANGSARPGPPRGSGPEGSLGLQVTDGIGCPPSASTENSYTGCIESARASVSEADAPVPVVLLGQTALLVLSGLPGVPFEGRPSGPLW